MRATQPILLAPWLQPCYAHHTYLLILLRNNGCYFRNLFETRLLSLVNVQPSGSQTFMSRGLLVRLAGEYLIYRDTWIMEISRQSYLAKVSVRGPQRTAQ